MCCQLTSINGHYSHAELLTYIEEKKQVNAPIRQLDCYIHVPHEGFDIQHPLFGFILSMPMLEEVNFFGMGGKATIDAFS